MAKKPEARYQNARQFLDAVKAAHAAERGESAAVPARAAAPQDGREDERTIPVRRAADPDATVPSSPAIGSSGAAAVPRSRKGLALAAGLVALLVLGAGFAYLLKDSSERTSIERARAEAERRAADAEARAKKETERADEEARARAKTEAARSEDQRREAEAAKARSLKEAAAKTEAARREEALRRDAEAKAETARKEEQLRREAEAAAARAAELARRESEEKTKLSALRAEEAKRQAALAKKEADDKARAAAVKQAAAKKADDARKAVQARAEQALRDKYKAGTTLSDCADCPQLVVIAAGEFTMGSPASESGRFEHEGPQHAVRVARPFALGKSEITFAEFQRFVQEAGYRTEAERDVGKTGCFAFNFSNRAATKNDWQPGTSWRNPGFEQTTERDPVVCVSWNDAQAYVRWLSAKSGKSYRLPTEAQWEYAARAGTQTARPWGDDPAQACAFANVADQSTYRTGVGPGSKTWSRSSRHECNDGRYLTAPAGSYKANAFGLFDMLGNAWEWTEDCWNAAYQGAPAEGSAWLAGDCTRRVIRGGSWGNEPRLARSATRERELAGFRRPTLGFRVARTLD